MFSACLLFSPFCLENYTLYHVFQVFMYHTGFCTVTNPLFCFFDQLTAFYFLPDSLTLSCFFDLYTSGRYMILCMSRQLELTIVIINVLATTCYKCFFFQYLGVRIFKKICKYTHSPAESEHPVKDAKNAFL